MAAFLTVVRDLEPDSVRVIEKNRVIIRRVFRIKPRRRALDAQSRKCLRDAVNCCIILDSKTEVVQPGREWVVRGFGVGGPQHESEMAIVVLDVAVAVVLKRVLLETQQ